jgi:RND superfamily putative drug exporter
MGKAMKDRSFLFERWPRFAFRHAWQVIGGALLIIAVLAVLYSFLQGKYGDTFNVPGAEAQELSDLLAERFPATAGDTVTVVVKADAGFQDATVRAQLDDLVQRLKKLPEVNDATSPLDAQGAISADGTIGRVTVQYDKRASEVARSSGETLLDFQKQVSKPGFQVEAGGLIVQRAERAAPGSSEIVGIAAAVVILLLAFGSVVAMGLPIGTAIFGLSSGFFLVGIGAAWVSLPSFTAQFAAMIGIGVGIDYALLVTNRFREGVARGLSQEDATVKAANTAGRSVFFAGGTVVIALLGLWAAGIPTIGWVGTAGALVVALNVAVALLLLPGDPAAGGPLYRPLAHPVPRGAGGRGGKWLRVSPQPHRAAGARALRRWFAPPAAGACGPRHRYSHWHLRRRKQPGVVHLPPRLRPDLRGVRAGHERAHPCRPRNR